jgi:Flp pilus assembly protein TadD
MLKRVSTAIMLVMVLTIGTSHLAFAVGSSDPVLEGEPDYRDANRLIKAQDFRSAIPHLLRLDKDHPRNAEVLNLLGFAHRKLKDYPTAKRYYDASLEVEPTHRPALEYQGMWFIEMGDLPAARANLTKLQAICAACEETKDLEEALAAVKP